MTIYRWTEIYNVPIKPGVYAWYYSPEVTDYDLKNAINNLLNLKIKNDKEAASEVVKEFLYKSIFRIFQEEPYQAFVKGALKPEYKGYLEHCPHLSESLVSRIIEEPERLVTIKNVIESSTPNFASPIYIGMSDKLGKRLKQHKKLIEKYYSEPLNIKDEKIEELKNYRENGQKDRSFAMEVCRRKMIPSRLFVAINILDNIGKKYIDIENILNRIHYPLLGRN
jgi:hypothetical protein